MQKGLLVVIGGIALVAVLIYGYIWYTVKSGVDDMIAKVSPMAQIKYDSIHTSLAGSVGVNGLRIKPTMLNDNFEVGAVIIKTKNVWALLDMLKSTQHGQFPEEVELRIEDFVLDMNASYWAMLESASANQGPDPFSEFDALGCGDLNQFTIQSRRDMGYERSNMDMVMGLRYDKYSKVLATYLEFSAADWYDLEMDADIEADEAALAGPMANSPRIIKASLRARDAGYNRRKNEYCAAKNGSDVDTYIAEHVRLADEFLQHLGLGASKELLEAYAQHLRPMSDTRISVAPVEPIDVMTAASYNVGDLVEWLAVQVSVNDKPVENVSLKVDYGGALSQKELEEVEQKEVRGYPKFHSTDVAELGNHLGKPAKITTIDGRVLEGTILSVSKRVIKLNHRVGGGAAVLPVLVPKVRSAEVFR